MSYIDDVVEKILGSIMEYVSTLLPCQIYTWFIKRCSKYLRYNFCFYIALDAVLTSVFLKSTFYFQFHTDPSKMCSIVGWMVVMGDDQLHPDGFTITDPATG